MDGRHVQPFGLLHGGVSVVLAETLGSMAAALCLRRPDQTCVGLDINANHLRGVSRGDTVTGTARPLHLGGSTQVWSIEIRDGKDRLACISRLTVAVRDGAGGSVDAPDVLTSSAA